MQTDIRVLAPRDIEELVEWAGREGWNPGRQDAERFRTADPEGFLGVFDGDHLIAGISAVAYGDNFGFIGLYICRPEFRGQGFGRIVWDAGIARLGNRAIGLDGVPAQQNNYRSMGFNSRYESTRYSGTPGGKTRSGADVRPYEPADFEEVCLFDREYFPADRRAFLASWVAEPHQTVVVRGASGIEGFGVARECLCGFKIGPLFARSSESAYDMLLSLAHVCPGEIQIDVPDEQAEFITALRSCGMTPGFATSRMYRGPAPAMNLAGVFGTTTLELG